MHIHSQTFPPTTHVWISELLVFPSGDLWGLALLFPCCLSPRPLGVNTQGAKCTVKPQVPHFWKGRHLALPRGQSARSRSWPSGDEASACVSGSSPTFFSWDRGEASSLGSSILWHFSERGGVETGPSKDFRRRSGGVGLGGRD